MQCARRLMSLAMLTTFSVFVVCALASPAGAATVLADSRFKWFYWIGPLLVLSFVGWMVALALGYYVRVLRPKWRAPRQ